MLYLILAAGAIFSAPLLYWLGARSPRTFKLMTVALYAVIAGLVLFQILPQSVVRSGWLALLLALLGFALPSLGERALHGLAEKVHKVPQALAFLGLVMHTFFDGTALGALQGQTAQALPLAVILHRIPEGLVLWWLCDPETSRTRAYLGLTVAVAVAAGGFFFGEYVFLSISDHVLIGYFQALVAGSLLHLLFHNTTHQHHDDRRPYSHGHSHEHDHKRGHQAHVHNHRDNPSHKPTHDHYAGDGRDQVSPAVPPVMKVDRLQRRFNYH